MRIPVLSQTQFITCALLGTALLLFPGSAGAQGKIATIDLKKVFDSYYKTKLADAQLKERGSNIMQVGKGMYEDGQKAQAEYSKLVESSKDSALSAEERDKRTKSAESKLRELQEIEESIRKFDQQSRITIDEQKQRMRDNILKDIREMIDGKAKTGGFSFVLDTSGETVTRTPFVLYATMENDLTQEILTKLNSTAPPSLQKEEESKDKATGSKDDKKSEEKK